MAASESYPDDLRYHREHDWARIDGDEATLGITWFAQDALGELVQYEAPEEGSTVAKDATYGEVESVKAVSDVITPLSGEVLEVNARVVDAPETVNEDPYGEVESVKAVSDIVAPLSGEVLEVNAKVVDEPETVNDDPYGDGWLVRIRITDPSEVGTLMDADAYRAHVAEQ